MACTSCAVNRPRLRAPRARLEASSVPQDEILERTVILEDPVSHDHVVQLAGPRSREQRLKMLDHGFLTPSVLGSDFMAWFLVVRTLRPFSAATLSYAKGLVLAPKGRPSNRRPPNFD